MRKNLRDALDEVRPQAIQAALAVAVEEQGCGEYRICTKCGSPPAHTDELRYCGRCAAVHYCSRDCAKEHSLAGAQARVRGLAQGTRQGARRPRSAGRSETRLQQNATGRRELVYGGAWVDQRSQPLGVGAPRREPIYSCPL